MTYQEMKAKRNELLEKADNARHECDIWGTCENAARAYRFQKEADALLKEMCAAKGVDWHEIF